MNDDFIKVNLVHDSYYEDKRIDELKAKADGLPKSFYCDCCRSIARFYLFELEYSKRRQPGVVKKRRQKNLVKYTEVKMIPRFWHDSYEEYYTKEFSRVALDILRFTLCAGLGEARHALNAIGWCNVKDEKRKKKELHHLMRVLFGSLGWKNIPASRDSVYRVYVPERLWWRMFVCLKEIFGMEGWGSAFGGKQWRIGIELAMKVYKSICLGERVGIVVWLDTLINHCHNGGLMLNKFNCGGENIWFNIKRLLDDKKMGCMKGLKSADSYKGCLQYERLNCRRFILLAPTD